MPICYHVDRARSLAAGQIIELNKVYPSNPEAGSILEQLFPEGLSFHGRNYLNDRCQTLPSIMAPKPYVDFDALSLACLDSSNRLLEVIVELYRRTAYPEKPARMQSLFALNSLDDLSLWPVLEKASFPIFEIETAQPMPIFDAHYLRGGVSCFLDRNQQPLLGASPSLILCLAEKYYSGHISENPQPEVLIPLPLRIGKRIR